MTGDSLPKVRPLQRFDEEHHKRHIQELNAVLARLVERLRKLEGTSADALTRDNLREALDEIDTQTGQLATSAADAISVGRLVDNSNSTTTNTIDETGVTALEDALPDNPPPNIALVSQIGTTTDPPHFALEDHTHGGLVPPGFIGGSESIDMGEIEMPAPFGIAGTSVSPSPTTSGGFAHDFLVMGA